MLATHDITIQDGGLGVSPSNQLSVFCAIGVGDKVSKDVMFITSIKDINNKIGGGPLRDFLADAFSFKITPIVYAISLEGTVDGEVSSVEKSSTNIGAGSISVSGKPRNQFDINIKIASNGGLNESTFDVFVDNKPLERSTVPLNGVFVCGDTGLTINFNEGNPITGQVSFAINDFFSFSTTAPKVTNGELLDALEKILSLNRDFRFIAIPIITDKVLWSVINSRLEMETSRNRYTFAVTMGREPSKDEALDQFVNKMSNNEDERGITHLDRVQVVLSMNKIDDIVLGYTDERSAIGKYCAWIAIHKRSESPGKTRNKAISGISGFKKYKEDSFSIGHLTVLDEAGYVTTRTYNEETGIYFTSGRMLNSNTSDFSEVMYVDVMNRACFIVAKALFVYLNQEHDIDRDGSISGIEYIKKVGQNAIDDMQKIEKEISWGNFIVPEGQDLLKTKTLEYFIEIIPKGYTSRLKGTIKFANPNIGGE